MRSRKKTISSIGFLLYLVVVWFPLFFVVGKDKADIFILPDARRMGLLLNSIKLAGSTVIIACAIGLLAALFIHNSFLRDKWYRFFFVILMPVPYYIYALSWMYLIRLLAVIWPDLLKYSAQGFGASLFVEVMTFVPIAVLFALAALEMRNRQVEEMALLYKKPVQVLLRNTIPEIAPYMAAAAGIIFILSMTDFSVPSMFQYNTYALEIFSVYSRTGSVTRACGIALPLLILLLLPLSFIQQAIKKISKPQRSMRCNRPKYPLWLRGCMSGAFVLLVCQVVFPIVTFIITTDSFQNIWKSVDMIYEQIGISFVISLLAAVINIIFASMATGFLVNRGSGIFWLLALGTMAVPGALQAMCLLDMINGSVLHWMSTTILMPAMGCALRYMPFSLIVLACTVKRADRKRRELAVLFENRWYQHILLEVGMFLPGILCAMLLVFFLSFGEEGIVLVLMPPGAETVSVKIYNYLHYGASEYVSGFCLIVTLFMFCIEAMVLLLIRSRYRGRKRVGQ